MTANAAYCLVEYEELVKHRPGDILCLINDESLLRFDAIYFVRRGPLQGAALQLCIALPRLNDAQDMRAHIHIVGLQRFSGIAPLLHPAVDVISGELAIDCGAAPPRWRPGVDRLWHLFARIRKTLTLDVDGLRALYPLVDYRKDDVARAMLHSDGDAFAQSAAAFALESRRRVMDVHDALPNFAIRLIDNDNDEEEKRHCVPSSSLCDDAEQFVDALIEQFDARQKR
jgi:hypothetical protein